VNTTYNRLLSGSLFLAGAQLEKLLRGQKAVRTHPHWAAFVKRQGSRAMAYSIKHGRGQNAPSERRETATACLERVKELQAKGELELKVYDRAGAEITVIELERLSGKEMIWRSRIQRSVSIFSRNCIDPIVSTTAMRSREAATNARSDLLGCIIFFCA
jgi:hypothetical protein